MDPVLLRNHKYAHAYLTLSIVRKSVSPHHCCYCYFPLGHVSHCIQQLISRFTQACLAGTSPSNAKGSEPGVNVGVGVYVGPGIGQPPSTEFFLYQLEDGNCVFLHPLVLCAPFARCGSYVPWTPQLRSYVIHLYHGSCEVCETCWRPHYDTVMPAASLDTLALCGSYMQEK